MAVTDAVVTRVLGAVVAVELKAANRNRRGITIFNESSAYLYVKCGPNAAADDYTVRVDPGGYANFRGNPIYVGLITGIWSAATGAAQVTEFYG